MALYLTEKHIKYKNGKDDCVSPFFIYQNNNKRTKVFCSLKISNKNWCFDKKRVKSSDKESGLKNKKIKLVKLQIESIIDSYKLKNEPLTPETLKAEFEITKILDSDIKNIKTRSLLNSKIPIGPLANKWKSHKGNINLVSPSNKRNIDIIVVGTGLAGASASATLAELGYNVKAFCFQDSPRRAHSIAAQGGINAAKNYTNDGDSVHQSALAGSAAVTDVVSSTNVSNELASGLRNVFEVSDGVKRTSYTFPLYAMVDDDNRWLTRQILARTQVEVSNSAIFHASSANYDAKAFYQYAKNIFGVKNENIKILIDNEANLVSSLGALNKWLPSKIKKKHTELIIFFAGHGLASPNGKELYLLPQDGDSDLLERTAISRNEVFDIVKKLQPKKVTVFFDTCYSGVSRDEETLMADARPLRIIADDQEGIPDNFTIFSASQLDQISSGLKEVKHGIFSYYLMKGLEGNADFNNDNKITNGELLSYMDENVSQKASELGRQQNPSLAGDPNKVLISYR